jgi:Tat protein translocase TatB subunit
MFGTLGGPELFLIFVVALIVFGPRKLPEIGKSIGKMMAEFRRASNEFKSTIESEVEAEKIRDSMRIESPPAAPAYPVEPSTGTAGAPETAAPTETATTPETADAAPEGGVSPADAAPEGGVSPADASTGVGTPPAPAQDPPDAPREPVPETVSRQPEPTPIEPK